MDAILELSIDKIDRLRRWPTSGARADAASFIRSTGRAIAVA